MGFRYILEQTYMKKPKPILTLKRFIVRKYVMAHSAREALKIEKGFEPDDIFVDDEYMKNLDIGSKKVAGFHIR